MAEPSWFKKAWVNLTWPADEAALFNDRILCTPELKKGFLDWKAREVKHLTEYQKHGAPSNAKPPQFKDLKHIEEYFGSSQGKQNYRDWFIEERRKEAEATRARKIAQEEAVRQEREVREAIEHEMAELRQRDPVAAYKQHRNIENFIACIEKNGFDLTVDFRPAISCFINNTKAQIPLAAIPGYVMRHTGKREMQHDINFGQELGMGPAQHSEQKVWGVIVLTQNYLSFAHAGYRKNDSGEFIQEHFTAELLSEMYKQQYWPLAPFNNNRVHVEKNAVNSKFFEFAGLYDPPAPPLPKPKPPAL